MTKYEAIGRRKTSIARVILEPGTGKIIVNKQNGLDYIKRQTLMMEIEKPLQILKLNDKYDVNATVNGGGLSGQAGAIRLGISRAFLKVDENYRHQLKEAGLLTRDSRMVERKKYGQPKARKKFQFSKR